MLNRLIAIIYCCLIKPYQPSLPAQNSKICIEYATSYDQSSQIRPSFQKIQLSFNLTCINYGSIQVSKLIKINFTPKNGRNKDGTGHLHCVDFNFFEDYSYRAEVGISGWNIREYCRFERASKIFLGESKAILRNLGTISKNTGQITKDFLVEFEYFNLHLFYDHGQTFGRRRPANYQKITFSPKNFKLYHPDITRSMLKTTNENEISYNITIDPKGMKLDLIYKITSSYDTSTNSGEKSKILTVGGNHLKFEIDDTSHHLIISYNQQLIFDLSQFYFQIGDIIYLNLMTYYEGDNFMVAVWLDNSSIGTTQVSPIINSNDTPQNDVLTLNKMAPIDLIGLSFTPSFLFGSSNTTLISNNNFVMRRLSDMELTVDNIMKDDVVPSFVNFGKASISSRKMVKNADKSDSKVKFDSMLQYKEKSVKNSLAMQRCKIGQLHDIHRRCRSARQFKNNIDYYHYSGFFNDTLSTNDKDKTAFVTIKDIGRINPPLPVPTRVCPVGILAKSRENDSSSVLGMSFYFENVHQEKSPDNPSYPSLQIGWIKPTSHNESLRDKCRDGFIASPSCIRDDSKMGIGLANNGLLSYCGGENNSEAFEIDPDGLSRKRAFLSSDSFGFTNNDIIHMTKKPEANSASIFSFYRGELGSHLLFHSVYVENSSDWIPIVISRHNPENDGDNVPGNKFGMWENSGDLHYDYEKIAFPGDARHSG